MNLTKVINEIQSSNLDNNIVVLACKAIQEYYRTLEAAGAVKSATKKEDKAEAVEMEDSEVTANGEKVKVSKPKKKASKKK